MEKTSFLTLKENNLLLVHGRYYTYRNNIALSFSMSYVEFNFYGNRLDFSITGTNYLSDVDRPYILIFKNDKIYKKIGLFNKKSRINIINLKNKKQFNIKIMKMSESQCSDIYLSNLYFDGEIKPIENKSKLKIEIYGDSLTCGYAVEARSFSSKFKTKDENIYYAYPYYLSKGLSREVSLICAGGFPIYQSKYSMDSKVKDIPSLISKASIKRHLSINQLPMWDNSKFVPDIVIINLGGNDCSVPLSDFNVIKFKEKLINFFDSLIDLYSSKVKIIFFTQMIPLKDYVLSSIKDVINSYKHKIYYFETSSYSLGGILPGEGHPNKKMHQVASKELESFIESIL